jgi:toxin ParE1/3/4
MRGLRLGRKAREDLARLHDEGIGQFGMAQAERYFTALERALAFLAEYPFAARERLETTPPVHIHPSRSHVIVYRNDDRGVLVLRVRHAREDWRSDPLA